MKIPTRLAASLVLAACAACANAQMPGPGPNGPSAMPNDPSYGASGAPPDPVAYTQQNLASLRSRLALAPNQAPAWNGFVDAVMRQSRDMQAVQAQMAQAPTAAPDRLARMADAMRRGADDMANVSRAMRNLYGQLDPNQRAIVDQEFSRGPGAPPQG